MSKTRIERESACIAKIDLECGGSILGPATGFFYKNDIGTYLVTNWHVCSGRRSDTGVCIHSQLWTPDTLSVTYFNFEFARKGLKIPLSSNGDLATWLQHPILGKQIDVAVIPWNPPSRDYEPALSWEIKTQNFDILKRPGDDVFINGFPKGLDQQFGMPVWKRGSIASEPNLPVTDKKQYLIDSVTRDGMSGSPVFLIKRGGYVDIKGTHNLAAEATQLLGVYSGRYGSSKDDTVDVFAAQLGICWDAGYIEEIISGQVRGDLL